MTTCCNVTLTTTLLVLNHDYEQVTPPGVYIVYEYASCMSPLIDARVWPPQSALIWASKNRIKITNTTLALKN